MTDALEDLRHQLADVEAAIEALGGENVREDEDLHNRRDEITQDILKLEAQARREAGVIDVVAEEVGGDVSASRPAATDLVVASLPPGADRDHATMVVLDKADEDQVLSIIEERMDRVLLYDFNRSGTKVIDLSIKGVLEVVRLLNATGHARIRVMPETRVIERERRDVGNGEEEFVICSIAAMDEVSGLVVVGESMEPVLMRKRDGTTPFDVFCRSKALSKAQRNALKGHIPERLRQAVIAMHKGDQQRVLEVKHGAGATAAAQLPPPVDSPEAKALEEECRETWQRIRTLKGWRERMLPGQYGAKLSRARSSIAELEAFRDALLSLEESLR